MKVQSIQNINIHFTNNPSQNASVNSVSPKKDALKTAGVWLGFGLGFDFLCRKFVIYKNSPVKNSLAVNGILASLAGGITFMKDILQNRKNNNRPN